MMQKSTIMVAGLLSILLFCSQLNVNSTSVTPGRPSPYVPERLMTSLQENRPKNALSPVPADTIGRLTEAIFRNPPASAKPWVFWYWMQAGVSKAGITADLEAMQEAGIGGAYLMSIKDTTSPPLINPPVRQLTPEWWDMVRFSMQEAKRLGLKLAMHVSDGFALAGGPWITPELSMQKLVWSKEYVKGGEELSISLPQPETNEDYYKDLTVVAYPA